MAVDDNFMSNITRKYQFLRAGRGISFNSNGQIGGLFYNSQLKPDTLAKMAEGLNHFLEYFYHTDEAKYEHIGRWMFMKILTINQDVRTILLSDVHNYNSNRDYLIHKHILPDPFILEYICEYVANCSKVDVNEEDATTEVTLRNVDCAVLHALTVVIKFTYILITYIRGDKRYEEVLGEYIDTIIHNIIKTSEKYFDYNGEFDLDDEHNHIINFMYKLYEREWTKQNTSFQLKFEEIGRDVVKLSLTSMTKIFTSFRKYVPSLIDMDNPKYKLTPETETSTVYWTIDKDWTEFALVNKNIIGYVRNTTNKIIKKQDSKSIIANVNIPDFIQDVSSDESYVHKEHALYYDKKKFMYERSKKTTVKLFTDVMKTLDDMDKHGGVNTELLNQMSIAKTHVLNRYILNKVLLALTGDCRIYVDQLGAFSKFILLLFYEKVKRNPELKFLNTILQCMTMTPTHSCMFSLEEIREKLKIFNVHDVAPSVFAKLLPVYVKDEYSTYPELMDMLDFYSFMSNPSRIRALIYPERYEEIDVNPKYKRDRSANEYEAPILNNVMEVINNGFRPII